MDLVAIIVGLFSPCLRCKCRLTRRDGQTWTRKELGDYGEKVARHWLRAQGAKILARNYRARRGGEVDLIVCEKNLLVFVEVKTRRAGGLGRGLDAVDRAKQRLIERGANAWLNGLRSREIPWRFDVVEVILEEGSRPRVKRVEDAF